jgi:hypothetical protein
MLNICRPSEEEIMAEAKEALRRNRARGRGPAATLAAHFRRAATLKEAGVPPELSTLLSRTNMNYVGSRPAAFEKPRYGTPAYAIARKIGWITAEEEKGDRAAYEERQRRSLQTCHRFSLYERPRSGPPRNSDAYVPELAARLENDRNLTDGARRCARKLAELTYLQNREERCLDVKVYYLMKALGRSRRTVQRYLRLLEREGYIRVKVIKSRFARMCIGLVVELCGPLFARHHREKWPERKVSKTLRNRANAGASKKPQNQKRSFSLDYYKEKRLMVPAQLWAIQCMDGVYRAFMKTVPLLNAPS